MLNEPLSDSNAVTLVLLDNTYPARASSLAVSTLLIKVTISAKVSASAEEADKIASTLPFSIVIEEAKEADASESCTLEAYVLSKAARSALLVAMSAAKEDEAEDKFEAAVEAVKSILEAKEAEAEDKSPSTLVILPASEAEAADRFEAAVEAVESILAAKEAEVDDKSPSTPVILEAKEADAADKLFAAAVSFASTSFCTAVIADALAVTSASMLACSVLSFANLVDASAVMLVARDADVFDKLVAAVEAVESILVAKAPDTADNSASVA